MKARMFSMLGILLVVLSLTLVTAAATTPVATRDLPNDCVDGTFDVQISASDYGMFGQVKETLCDGWTYTGSSLNPSQVSVSGNEITFTLISSPQTFTYTVQAPSNPGECCTISGTIEDQFNNVESVTGEYQVCVCSGTQPGAATATRDLPDDCVDGTFNVQISASDYGMFGQVKETLCDGWTYTGSSLNPSQVSVSGNEITFTLIGSPQTFTYTVQAPSNPGECCTISGTIEDQFNNVESVTGEYQVCVCSGTQPGAATATRDLPDDCVDGTFNVQISASDYGMFGQVKETLCDGWTYTGSSLNPSQVSVSGNEITFTLIGSPQTFTYSVQAPSNPGECCTISGTIKDQFNNVELVTGEYQVCVCTPTDPPTVEVTSPNGGEVWCSIHKITANASDTDGTIVSVEFLYSHDGGVSWVSLNNDASAPYEYNWDTTSVASGQNYLIKAIAKDNNSATAMDTSNSTFTIQKCPGIPLCEGWNLISVPSVLDNDSIEYVLDGVEGVEAIIWYDASTQNWVIPTEITPLTAFTIKVNTSGMITNLEYMPSVPPSIQMYEGWNLVGLTGMDKQNAEFTFSVGGIDNNYSKVWGPWDCEDEDYTQHGYNKDVDDPIGSEDGKDVYTENYIMNPYEGHWIKMTDDAILEAIG
jgi:hypothetical protein